MTATGPADSAPRELYSRKLYLRGREFENSRSLTGLQTAKALYQQAIARDSAFALGYAGLAGVYRLMADYAYAPVGPSLDSARLLAMRAMRLDSMLPDTRATSAITLADDGHFDAAERELRKAIELSGSSAFAHYWYSVLLVALGRGEEALREADTTLALDPFPPRGANGMRNYALRLISGAPPARRQRVEPTVLKNEPAEPWALARTATNLAEDGRCAEAQSEIARAQQITPDTNFRMIPFVGTVYWRCGEQARARALLNAMKRRPGVREHGYRVAILHTLFGETDSAFAWLDRERWILGQLAGLSADSWLDPLRSDPQFPRLLQRIGIRPGLKPVP